MMVRWTACLPLGAQRGLVRTCLRRSRSPFSDIASGVGAHVVGTFPPQHDYELPGDIYPTSTNDVPLVKPTGTVSVSAPVSNLSVGAIAGIALGAVAFLALVAALVARTVLVKRRKAKTESFAGKVDHTLRRNSTMAEVKKPVEV